MGGGLKWLCIIYSVYFSHQSIVCTMKNINFDLHAHLGVGRVVD